MDTKLKNTEKSYKTICFVLAIVFAALSGISTLQAVNSEIIFDSSNKSVTGTIPFIYTFKDDITKLRLFDDIYRKKYKDITDFTKNSPEAKEIQAKYEEYEKEAFELCALIETLKERCPGNVDDYPAFIEENGDGYTDYDEYDEYEYYDSSEDVTSAMLSPVMNESVYIEEKYTDYGLWADDYTRLRDKLFSIVNDARSERTIKNELSSKCNDEIESMYYDYCSSVSYAENSLYDFVNFKYVYVAKNGDVYTNIDKKKTTKDEFIKTLSENALFYAEYKNGKLLSPAVTYNSNNDFLNFLTKDLLADFKSIDGNCFDDSLNGSLYIKINNELEKGDSYYFLNKMYENCMKTSNINKTFATLFFILSVASLIALVIFMSRTKKDEIKLYALEKIPFIIQLAIYLFMLALALTGYVICFVPFEFPTEITSSGLAFILSPGMIKLCMGIVSAFAMLFTELFLIYIVRNVKAGKLSSRFIIGLVITFFKFIGKKIKNTFRRIKNNNKKLKSVKSTTIALLCGYFGIVLIFAAIIFFYGLFDNWLLFVFSLLFIGFNIAALIFALHYTADVVKLSEYAEEIKKGNLEQNINVNSFVKPLRKFASDLNNCRDSIKTAVEEAVKGERFKTELITNVSHDLKTPLTSIINYVSLLKLENISEDDKREYLDILEQKSKKLQRLIEDLTEASKANSGNMNVTTETASLNELALQAVGENSDALEEAGLDLIFNEPDENILIKCNPQKTSRVIDNLFSNAKKYSLNGTRVYADVYKEKGYGVFTLKNISKEKLNIPPEELTERFVRGDKSRTTEGSGLGLSIAQSFTEIQGGIFKIDIDGDMFKAEIYLPLSN